MECKIHRSWNGTVLTQTRSLCLSAVVSLYLFYRRIWTCIHSTSKHASRDNMFLDIPRSCCTGIAEVSCHVFSWSDFVEGGHCSNTRTLLLPARLTIKKSPRAGDEDLTYDSFAEDAVCGAMKLFEVCAIASYCIKYQHNLSSSVS
jgi:hypothetical protein